MDIDLIKRLFKYNLWLLVIGGIVLYYDFRFFLFYLFAVLLICIDVIHKWQVNEHNTFISHATKIDRKLRAIVRHMKISEKEFERILKEDETETDYITHDELKKDFSKLK